MKGEAFMIRDDFVERITSVVPSTNQLRWQEMEFTAFFHFGINSFTDREWGDGNEDISIFNPTKLNTDQWCEAIKAAEIKGCILTAKHHDGFCLWDTAYTDHSVMHTPFKRDIVKELAASCKKYGLKFGIYLSPWDRHEKTYGQGKAYDDYFCNQLSELLTKYGELYTVWFDGACGEGANGKKQIYDWERYYALIRKLQPGAVISVCGPDVRWCGNEAGDCRESEWSVVPSYLFSQKAIQEASQQEDNTQFREKKLNEMDSDLGSREVLKKTDSYIWYPAEVDTSIRPGWFYHPSEDDKVKKLEDLKQIYINAVGGNCVLLLNIPPHPQGYLTEYDVKRLKEMGEFIRNSFDQPITEGVKITASEEEQDYEAFHMLMDDHTAWKPMDYTDKAVVEFEFSDWQPIRYIVLKERLEFSQRVESFRIEAYNDEEWLSVFEGTTIGYKKICPVDVKTKKLRIVFTGYRKCPVINCIQIYD